MNAPINKDQLAAFRALDAEAQLRQLRGQKVERTFTVERDTFDKEARTAWLSIASEEPYERWFGNEILDMNKASIRDQRLRMGAPLLVGHDTSDQVGVVERYEITPDKKLRILARFGKSARAEEIWQDVLDGIRRNTSVGYVIHDLVMESKSEDLCTYRVTDWEPLEGSIVPVPADPTVGVGRNLNVNQPGEQSIMDATEKAKIEAETRAKVEAEFKAKAAAEAQLKADAELAAKNTPDAVRAREMERVNNLIAAGDEYASMGGPEVARELIKDANATIETFKSRMFEKMRGGKPTATGAQPGGQPAQPYGSGPSVRYTYSALKAFRDLTCDDGTVMKAEEAAYRSGMWLAAALHKKDWAVRWCRDHAMPFVYRNDSGEIVQAPWGENAYIRAAANENVLSQGGALVPVEMEASIIMLRDTYGAMRRLARTRPMASDTLKIPRRKGGLTAYFFQDDDGVGITESSKLWDNVTLSTKKLGVLAKASRDLVEDAVISVIDDLAQESAYAFAVKEDNCYFVGDGTSTYGGMQGINNKFEATAYSSRTALTTGHDTFAEVDNADLTSVMGGVSQYAAIGPKFVCSNLALNLVFNRLKAVAGGNRVDTLGMPVAPDYLGYEIITSEAMPKVTTTLQNKVMFLFGRFDLASSVGSRRGIEMQTLVERYAELGQVGLIVTERFDINIHDLGDTSTKGPIAAGYGA